MTRRTLLIGGAVAAAALATPLPASAGTTPGPAVFVSPHQDDETLFMGGAIRSHVKEGRDVHVVLLGRGDGTVVRTRDMPKLLGRTPAPHEIGALRDREFIEACRRHGVPASNVHILPYEERMPEKFFTQEGAERIIQACVPAGSDLKSTSLFDPNPDHVAAARAIEALSDRGWTAYGPRYYGAEGITLTRQVRMHTDKGGYVTRWAQWSYRHTDIADGWWGVGYKSVRQMFDAQLAQPYSRWHF